jgi:RNA polymerase sigma factor (sigma-70 family)
MNPTPAQRIEALQPKINSIARKFQLSDQSNEDVAHTMIERLLTRCVEDPGFIARDDGYWLRFANWMGYHLLCKSIAYDRYIIKDAPMNKDLVDPYELYEQAFDQSLERNPESAFELAELRQLINSLTHHNRQLAALLMIGYTKSEIADEFKISRPAISQRLGTIRKNLNPIL